MIEKADLEKATYLAYMDKITLNNLIGLLEECATNGDTGPHALWAWFCAERELIDRTIKDAEE